MIGSFLARITRCEPAYYGYEDWPTYQGRTWVWQKIKKMGFAAITIGQVTIFFGHPTGAVVRHERAHFEQARKLGWKFLPAYAWGCVVGLVKAIHTHHPMEKEAREAERW